MNLLGKIAPASLAVVACLVLWPALATGWFGDDAFYANLPFAIETGRYSWTEALWRSYAGWLSAYGRWHPGLDLEKYVAFDVVRSRLAYKAALIAVSLVALGVAGRCFASVWGVRFALVALLFAVASFQIRGYHDPFLAYSGMIQVVTICLFWSLLLFDRRVRNGRGGVSVAGIALYFAACTVYEISYLFAPLYVIVASTRTSLRRAAQLSAPYAVIGAGMIALSAVLRLGKHIAPGDDYATHLDAPAYARAFADQAGAALPLSYFIFDPSRIFSSMWDGYGAHFSVFVFALAVLAACAVLVPGRDEPAARGRGRAALFGLALVVLPALAIPTVNKYQHELRPGIGYLPVFIEYLGFGALVAACVSGRFRARWQRVCLACAAAVVITFSTAANGIVAAVLRTPYLTSREAFERDLSHGLLAALPQDAMLAIEPEFPWVCHDGSCVDDVRTSDLIFHASSKSVRVVAVRDAAYVVTYDSVRERWSLARTPR